MCAVSMTEGWWWCVASGVRASMRARMAACRHAPTPTTTGGVAAPPQQQEQQ